MNFKYREGEKVKLKDASRLSCVNPDSEGIIWAFYDLVAPAYEVTFTDDAGKTFDMLVAEIDLVPLKSSTTDR